MTQKHTPTPYYAPVESAVKHGFPRWDIIAKDGDSIARIARVFPVGNSKKKRQANADFIVTACNNHEALLDALEYMIDMHEGEPLSAHVLQAYENARGEA